MKVKSLILFIIFSLFLISCESKNKWINPYDPIADQTETETTCSKYGKECGLFDVDYEGVTFKIDCGQCSDGYECRLNTCWDINECEEPSLNDCSPDSDCHNLDIKSDGKPYECICKENYSGDDCVPDSREQECTDLPANAEWNTASSIEQTWDGEEWIPSNEGTFNESKSSTECHYKCVSGYYWNGSSCVDPAAECVATSGTWNEAESTCAKSTDCIGLPENAEWNGEESYTQTYADGTWSEEISSEYSEEAGLCHFKCASGYNWNGSTCEKCAEWSGTTCVFFECSSSPGTPCKDSSSGLIWSARSSTMTWSKAKSYCENLTEGGLSGWHLPTIDELRTLLINADRVKDKCQVSEINGCLSDADCWTCSTCTETGTQSSSGTGCDSWGTSYSDGRYSKFGDTEWLWSSSIHSFHGAWSVDFNYGSVYGHSIDGNVDVGLRCVKYPAVEEEKCAEAGGTWNETESTCTKTAECSSKPADTEWNTVSSITQTYNGSSWSPSMTSSYNETASTSECRFKCKTNYFWEDEQCKNPCDPNPCSSIANSTGVCTINGSNYLCECNSGFDWKETQCVKPAYCSAVFDGSTSKIEVAHNNALNLAYDSWTIEAWIKQPFTADDEVPIVAKQNSSTADYVYSLSHYYRTGSFTIIKGSLLDSWGEFYVEAKNTVSNSGNWTHVALVQAVTTSSGLKKLTLALYINGQEMISGENDRSSNQTPFIATSMNNLIIGSTGTKSFSGLIGSIKISKTAKYSSNFTPSKLSVDSNTVAFWDFNGNADDSSVNNLHGTATDVTYSTDCE